MRTLPLLPRSFVTALLSAFALVLLPLAAALTLAVLQMHGLAERSRVISMRAAEVGAQSAAARESLLAIERNLRQAQVLGAVSMREAYEVQSERILRIVDVLTLDAHGGAQLQHDARAVEVRVDQALADGRPAVALEQFDTLAQVVNRAVDSAQRVRSAEQQALVHMPEQVSGTLLWLAAAAVPLATVLALLFAWQLGRPISRLGQAMQRLGEGDLDTRVALRGPADIVQLADRLEWLRARLALLENARNRFFRSMSHDLKTPIAAIAEGAASLDEQLYGTLNPSQRSVVALIRHNTEKLRARIESLLRADRAARDPSLAAPIASPARIELGALLRAVLDDHRLALARHRLRVEISRCDECAVIGDAEALRVAIDNLVSNAVKFSYAGGRIDIAISGDGDRAAIRVCDGGPGLAVGEEERIFASGARGAAARASGAAGSGQGLAIAREIAQAHGGRLAVAPSGGRRGACFELHLPRLREQREIADAAA